METNQGPSGGANCGDLATEVCVAESDGKRKTRSWYCPCCHGSIWRKKKDDREPKCNRCDVSMGKGQKYYSGKECKHTRAIRKIESFKASYCLRVRDAGGRILRVSPETRRLWKLVDKAKQRPTMLKRANEWMISLAKDSQSAPKGCMARYVDKYGNMGRSRWGLGAPKLIFEKRSVFEKGAYTRHFIEGVHEIYVDPNRNLLGVKETLLHETLHFLDDLAEIHEGHNLRFEKRMEWMLKKFPIKENKTWVIN